MSTFFLAAAVLPRLPAHRLALVALCVVASVALAASSAAGAAAPPGRRSRFSTSPRWNWRLVTKGRLWSEAGRFSLLGDHRYR
jgi:hypothetical protein